jgi:L-arabinose isomerase
MLAFVFSMPYWRTAAVTGIELVTIGADTTMPAFQQSLRWNQAFYFLDRGP